MSVSFALSRARGRARTLLTGGVMAGALVGSLAVPLTPAQATSYPAPGPAERAHPHLKLGATGHAVKWVQQRLDVQPETGYYGIRTRSAVRDFQRAHDMPVTWHVGNRMWRTLGVPGYHRSFGSKVLRTARALRGIPYVYGGTTPSGFDCSGFTGYVFARHGVSLPRVASDQYAATRHISRSNARRGDLVAFPGSGGIYHIGIYAGHNRIWHSPRTGSTVHRERIWTSNVLFGRVRH